MWSPRSCQRWPWWWVSSARFFAVAAARWPLVRSGGVRDWWPWVWLSSARLLSRCGIVAAGSWWCGRWVSVRGRCGLVAVGALQRCARPTASVARILQRLTRPVLCRVPVRCAPLLPTCQRSPWLVRGGGVRDWWPWFGCHRRGSLPGAGVEISIGAAALSMWDCGRWLSVRVRL